MYEYNLGLRFQNIAVQHPDTIALWFDKKRSVSYRELNQRANRVARLLVDQGLATRDVVCIFGEKTPVTFASIVACLKLGAIYCVLDPHSPAERLSKILSTCRPKVVLGASDSIKKLELITADLGTIAIENDVAEVIAGNNDDLNLSETSDLSGAEPAYIMFTSGSTGTPKGAVITHANVLNLIEWARETYSIVPEDVLTNVNPLYFDNSVFDFYAALFNGARLVPFTKTEATDPKAIVEKIDAAACTLWFSVPSLLIFLQAMKVTDGKNLGSIRRFIFGGEGYPKAKLKQLHDAYAASSEFFNVYGPTECTCICSSYQISQRDFDDLQGLPSLGHIARNFSYVILNDEAAVPAGEIGELCLSGPNVGQGYYNDPERTAAAFVQNPLNDTFREIVYRTGDLVRVDATDGKLYIEGRVDNQIKHMGYRIELEEIEAALHCLDYIDEAVALRTSANGLSRIVAVVASEDELDNERIRRDLGQLIPGYMIPSVFHREPRLPKNPNGKVDRRYLAAQYTQAE